MPVARISSPIGFEAIDHGSAWKGDGRGLLLALADCVASTRVGVAAA